MMTEVVRLITEYRSNPLGIDVTAPRLGWQMKTERWSAQQSASHVLAASTPEGLRDGKADFSVCIYCPTVDERSARWFKYLIKGGDLPLIKFNRKEF